jgi:hypothetical protein
VEWTADFDGGDVSFDAHVGEDSICCDYIAVSVDGLEVLRVSGSGWTRSAIRVPRGHHRIRWSYGLTARTTTDGWTTSA